MKIAILGAGPAGLLVAAAAKTVGYNDVQILSKDRRSNYAGAQFLHEEIPDVTPPEPHGMVQFVKIGTKEGYAEKVYGDPDAKVSWSFFDSVEVPAWNMGEVYEVLYDRFKDSIRNFVIKADDVGEISQEYDLVFSTIPKPATCVDDSHKFESQSVSIDHGSLITMRNVIIYSGRPADSWYRTSDIFGTGWTEYPARGPRPGKHVGKKPQSNTCDCYPQVIRAGRFGEWKRDILAHHAYDRALEELRWRV